MGRKAADEPQLHDSVDDQEDTRGNLGIDRASRDVHQQVCEEVVRILFQFPFHKEEEHAVDRAGRKKNQQQSADQFQSSVDALDQDPNLEESMQDPSRFQL